MDIMNEFVAGHLRVVGFNVLASEKEASEKSRTCEALQVK